MNVNFTMDEGKIAVVFAHQGKQYGKQYSVDVFEQEDKFTLFRKSVIASVQKLLHRT